MKTAKSYELATLHAPRVGTWLIIWRNIDPETGKLERIRKTFSINRIHDLQERRTVAANTIALINFALQQGWNHFTDNELPAQPEPESLQEQPKIIPLLYAFDQGLQLKMERKAASSVLSYTSVANIFRNYLNDRGMLVMDVNDFTVNHFQAYISERAADGKSSRNLNAHIDLVKHVFKKISYPLQFLKNNPLAALEYYDEEDSDRFDPLTAEELKLASAAIRDFDEWFLLFCYFIFYGHIRPSHIPGIQRRQIDFAADILHVRADNTKNKKRSGKQLLRPLKELLLKLDVQNLPPDSFLFSTEFRPGEKLVRSMRTRAQEFWKQIVIDGLGIEKKMYALKPTSGTAYISNAENVDPVWLSRQMEHGSLQETEAYIKKRTVRKIDDQSMNLPEF